MLAIVTDSTSDLPPELVLQHQIQVIPLYVHFGESIFKAGVNLTNEQFLYRLQSSVSMPTTQPPTVYDFEQTFKELASKYSEIISIHISSHLSETYKMALAAKEMVGNPNIHVVDSKSVSGGLGLMVIAAAQMALEGQPVQAILKQLESMITHQRLYFVVNTLEYLHKGGRIGGARALLGTALQMKPLLTMQEGHIEPLESVRTKPKAIARLRQLVIDGLAGRTHVHMTVSHCAAPDEAHRLQDDLVSVIEPSALVFCEIGPVVAAHTGPGVLGVAFYSDR